MRTHDPEQMAAEWRAQDLERTAGMEWSVKFEQFTSNRTHSGDREYRATMPECFQMFDDYKRIHIALGARKSYGNGWYYVLEFPDGSVEFVTLFAGGEQYTGVRLV